MKTNRRFQRHKLNNSQNLIKENKRTLSEQDKINVMNGLKIARH